MNRKPNLSFALDLDISEGIERIGRFLEKRGTAAYLVGGFVRDLQLGRRTSDVDLALDADPLQLGPELAQDLGGKFLLLDELNRIVRVVMTAKAADPFNFWYADFSPLGGADIRADLSRRDFSINAMAIELGAWRRTPADVPILDPCGGKKALKEKRVDAVGPDVFTADPARLLRALRFCAELDFKLGASTRDLVRRDSALVDRAAAERNREELVKILNSPRAGVTALEMDNLGLLTSFIPELEPARGVEQPREHHWDVLEHSLRSVQAVEYLLHQGAWEYCALPLREAVPWSETMADYFRERVSGGSTHQSLLKLAALLHDIAKPQTKIMAENRVRFYGHNEQGAAAVAALLERLRFSRKETQAVELMVRLHMRPTQMSHEGKPTPRAIYRYLRDAAGFALDILYLSLADHLAARGPDLDPQDWSWHVHQTCEVLEGWERSKQRPAEVVRLLDGNDLMREFSLSPGPRLRTILEALKEAQAVGEITSRAEALSYVKNRLL